MRKLLAAFTCTLFALSLFACASSEGERETGSGAAGASTAGSGAAGSGAAGSGAEAAYDARLDGVVEDGQALSEEDKAALSAGSAGFTDDVPVVLQYPEFESGCEIAALTAALQSMGFNVDMGEIVDDYLVVDGDYANGYLASPRTDYGGGFPPGVADAASAYLAAQGSSLRARDLTGSGFGGIAALVDAGYPVLVWTTLEQTAPNYDAELGAIDDWYVNEHCVTVYAVDNATATVTVSDPLKGVAELDAATFANVYTQCGSMALVIR